MMQIDHPLPRINVSYGLINILGQKTQVCNLWYDPTQHEKKNIVKKGFLAKQTEFLLRTKQLDFSINVLLPTVKGLMALHSCMYFTRK